MKALVAYFSAERGNTAKLANTLAEAIGADAFEIKPTEPYTRADLKWTNPMSRCNKEKFGKKDVPIAERVEGFESYDTVFIGFPIWYFAEPNIIDSFVKDYDFTEKKIVLFATSGGTDITKAPDKIGALVSGTVIGARRFTPDETAETLKEWVESLVL